MGLFDLGNLDWGQIATGMPTPQAPNFNDRFGAAFPRSPIAPEQLAAQLAARGVPPPPVDIPPQQTNVGAALTGNEPTPGQPYRMAGPEAMDSWRTGVDVTNAGVGGSPATPGVGGPAPAAPVNIQSPIQVAQTQGPTDVSASAKKPGTGDSLLDSLKGIKAPANPEFQRLGTPAAPRPTNTVKGGNLIAMLNALNAGAAAGDRNLPATLAAALRRG